MTRMRLTALTAMVVLGTAVCRPGDANAQADRIIEALEADFAHERGRTWDESGTNVLPDDWLLQTPPGHYWEGGYQALREHVPETCTPRGQNDPRCDFDFHLRTCDPDADNPCPSGGICHALGATVSQPGEEPRHLCVGHSDAAMLDQIHRLVSRAERHVDITSLARPADGRFLAALRNAITYLAHASLADGNREVTVRILLGKYPVVGDFDPGILLGKLASDLDRIEGIADSNLTIYSGNIQRSAFGDWNHSKIVAADGREALVGGHNMWTNDYLDDHPVHDLSMIVAGPAAYDAHMFADQLWDWTCDHFAGLTKASSRPSRWRKNKRTWIRTGGCPKDARLPERGDGGGDVHVISVGRLNGLRRGANPADRAIETLLDTAERTIRISQQDIGGMPWTIAKAAGIPQWDDDALEAIGRALARDVSVQIVTSSSKKIKVNGKNAPYSNNSWQPLQIIDRIRAALPDDADPQAICRLSVAPIRFRDWELGYGRHFPANHAKLVLVGSGAEDAALFYIGSQNLYPAPLAEFGYIVDDVAKARQLESDYWDPLWDASQADAVRAPECDDGDPDE